LISVRSEVQVFPGPPLDTLLTFVKKCLGIGAIAQLGERVLCKHEVVGSIPSGSTIYFTIEVVWVRSSVKKKSSAARVYVRWRDVCHCEEGIYVDFNADTRPSLSSRKAPRPDRVGPLHIFAKQEKLLVSNVRRCSLTATSAEGRTLIMRTIKCHKSIRWMPWR